MTGAPGVERFRQNIIVCGHRTSFLFERAMWDGLCEICRREGLGLNQLFSIIVARRTDDTMATTVRLTLLNYFRLMAEEGPTTASSPGGRPNAGDRLLERAIARACTYNSANSAAA